MKRRTLGVLPVGSGDDFAFALGMRRGDLAGALDRLVAGSVTDFIDVYLGTHHWPSFNVADSAISIGITLMILQAVAMFFRDSAAIRGKEL